MGRVVLRLTALVALMLVIELGMTLCASQMIRAGLTGIPRMVFFFGMGWNSFVPILLATWLTWGGGQIALRLLAVLATFFLFSVIASSINERLIPANTIPFGSVLVFTFAQILILHAIAAPLQSVLGYQLSFQQVSSSPSENRRLQWTMLDILAWMTFVISALALVRLNSAIISSETTMTEAHWLNFVTVSAPAVAVAPLILWAVFGKRYGLAVRIALLAAAFLLAFGIQQGTLLTLAGRWRAREMSLQAIGVVSAALFNFGVIRLAGVCWRRAVEHKLPLAANPSDSLVVNP
jgi:hypothetical protein